MRCMAMRFMACGRVCWLLSVVGLLLLPTIGSADALPEEISWSFRGEDPPSAGPPAPPLPDFALELMIDDGSAEGDFGVGAATAQQFLWFNRFDRPSVRNYDLEEIWVLFSPGSNMAVGEPIQLVVYRDPDGDPTTGAELLATIDETIQVLDGNTFSVYSLDPPVPVQGPGDFLVGVVSRFVESGVTGPTEPAALDTDSSAGQSWLAIWTGDPPPEPELPPDLFLDRVDVFVPGNWMIRAFGSPRSVIEVPTLSGASLIVLIALLAMTGLVFVRRRGCATDRDE